MRIIELPVDNDRKRRASYSMKSGHDTSLGRCFRFSTGENMKLWNVLNVMREGFGNPALYDALLDKGYVHPRWCSDNKTDSWFVKFAQKSTLKRQARFSVLFRHRIAGKTRVISTNRHKILFDVKTNWKNKLLLKIPEGGIILYNTGGGYLNIDIIAFDEANTIPIERGTLAWR